MRSRQDGTTCHATSDKNAKCTDAFEPSPRLIMAVVAIGMIFGALFIPKTSPSSANAKSAVASLYSMK